MNGHPLARLLEQWWKDHGQRHDDPEWLAYVADYSAFFAQKMRELTSEHSNAGDDGVKRFGMSKASGCTRAAGLKLLGYEAEPFSGSSLVTFHIGHLLEGMVFAGLPRLGIAVDGAQHPVRIDPFMHSASDGIILEAPADLGLPFPSVLSVKSTGYKKSGQERSGKWTRRGFPELPFEGVAKKQPSWWAQAQAEMYGHGMGHAVIVVVAKDIVKAMEKDPYLGEGGNGSLTFYAEVIERDDYFIESQLLPVWQRTWEATQAGRGAAPYVLNAERREYVRLPVIADTDKGWGGPNQQATGTFNPCGGCEWANACKLALAKEYRG